MIRKGLCVYCSKPAVVHTCNICGASVCTEHYDAENGLCFKCAEKMKPRNTQEKRM